MKKLIIELNQTFEIEIDENEIEEMLEEGVDISNVDDVCNYINAEEIMESELNLFMNSYAWFEDEEDEEEGI